ncbi:MAG: PilW family protein [Thiohalomonadales bacterium]
MEINNKIKTSFGLSLIELMVALAISSILAIGIINMYSASKKSFSVQNDSSALQNSGRFVFNMLISDIRRTGYFGFNPGIDLVQGTEAQVINTNTCPTNANWALMLDRKITGLNEPVTPYDCISNYLAGDVLSLRYVEGGNVTEFDNDRYYLRSSFQTGRVFRGADSNDVMNTINDGTPVATGKLNAYAYYVGNSGRTCKFNDTNGDPIKIPTLYRESLDETGGPARQEIATGIENIQFRYGVDTNGDKSVNQYLDSNFININNVTPNWNQVVSVRFWILARADCPANIPDNRQTTFEMGEITVTNNDKFKRQLFTSTVALRN